jgi:transcriptional antiterminator NusG
MPTPMTAHEVERMLAEEEVPGKPGEPKDKPKVLIPYSVGDRVKVRDGTFAGMEGEVKEIVHPADPKENPKVKVVLTIWGRPVDVDVEYWQVEQV